MGLEPMTRGLEIHCSIQTELLGQIERYEVSILKGIATLYALSPPY